MSASAALAEAISAGRPTPLGAQPQADGVNFALHSRVATAVELCLYDPGSGAARGSVRLPMRTGDTWHGFLPLALVRAGDCYAYRVHGERAPERGLRCNPQKLLLDPAARALTGLVAASPLTADDAAHAASDSAPAMPRCRIVAAGYDWGGDRAPARPWRDTVIYELHVKGFTRRHPRVPERLRGTYLGLAEPAVGEWLTGLGITAVELLPCQAFASERFLEARGLTNYWGYNPIAWSAPANQYALADPVAEFRQMVKALHAAGLEVILDVVFNHSAEGDASGPTLSLRGIDNPSYYRLLPGDPAGYANFTGTGNTVNAAEPAVQALILDCLRWWVTELHVDGFRFDLAPVLAREPSGFNARAALFAALRADPVLAYVKLIAEPWDVGAGGYQLGHFPAGWSEWNDRYRDVVRGFWRGDRRLQGAFAERYAGSSDLFRGRGRKPSASINFVTAHDGFTLADLVSYAERHNEANLEGNADGTANNLSWNCGVEGPSDDAQVRQQRARQQRSLLLTLLTSQGVPMLQAGDEFARTQRGNNNAYCQDNELSWLDWSAAEREADLTEFTRRLIGLRRRRPELRRETFLKGSRRGGRGPDISWLHPAGRELTQADWQDPALEALGVLLAAEDAVREGELLVLCNAGASDVEFRLPVAGAGRHWQVLLDAASALAEAPRPLEASARVAAHAAMVLEARGA